MTRGMDRAPALPPAAKARLERNAARRGARRAAGAEGASRGLTLRFWAVSLIVGAAVGYLAWSVYHRESFGVLIGLGVGLLTVATAVGLRLVQRRTASARR